MRSKVNQHVFYNGPGLQKPHEVVEEERRLHEKYDDSALLIVWSKQSDDDKTWEVYWYVPTYNKTRFRYDQNGVLIPSLKDRIVAFAKDLFARLGYHHDE